MKGVHHVVPATAGHVPALPEIERSAATLFGDDVPAQLVETVTPTSLLAAAQRDGTLWVAIGPDDQPVGFARLELVDKRAHLAELDVFPAHGRRGVGTALLRTVEAWALSNGFSELTLTTYREFPWNEPFYARLGYEVVPERDLDDDLRERFEQEAGMESEQARRVVMRKRLGTVPRPRLFAMEFARVYPLYVQKAERKHRTKDEVDQIIFWLTGYDDAELQRQIEQKSDLETFFAQAPAMHPNSSLITGVVCGVRVEEVEDPLMQKIRYLDKLVDELAKGKAMDKILRKGDDAR